MQTVSDYFYFYKRFLFETWNTMSPMEYGFMLVAIAVVGWLCMKSAPR